MSKKAKTKSQLKRARERKAQKEANRSRYEGYMARGINTKSKRNTARGRGVSKVRATSHLLGMCGNIGCNKCFAMNFEPFLVDGRPKGMRQWMYMRWAA